MSYKYFLLIIPYAIFNFLIYAFICGVINPLEWEHHVKVGAVISTCVTWFFFGVVPMMIRESDKEVDAQLKPLFDRLESRIDKL